MKKLKALFTAAFMGIAFMSFAQQHLTLTNETECDIFIEVVECNNGPSTQQIVGAFQTVVIHATLRHFVLAEFSAGYAGDFDACPSNGVPIGAPTPVPCVNCLAPANYPSTNGWQPAGCLCGQRIKATWTVDCANDMGTIVFQ